MLFQPGKKVDNESGMYLMPVKADPNMAKSYDSEKESHFFSSGEMY